MNKFLSAVILTAVPFCAPAADKPIKALIVTGGCCHNYAFQSQAITQAVGNVAKVEWTILQDASTGTRPKTTNTYDNANWAAPYDIIIHNECFADVTDPDYIQKITKAHADGKNQPSSFTAPCIRIARRRPMTGANSSASPAAVTIIWRNIQSNPPTPRIPS